MPDGKALLGPLAEASRALPVFMPLESVTPATADGLRARIALREAAGWLARQYGTWVPRPISACGRPG